MADHDDTYEGWLDSDEVDEPSFFDEAGCPRCGYWDYDPETDGMDCHLCKAVDEANGKGLAL